MASTPTTKSQVQAYRFVLRRMESALVRKDAVMLHDPMGSHKRATLAGAVLASVGVIGFLVWGLFGGKGSVPDPGSIVIGKDSGSVYVVTADDRAQKRLIPMLNMASAKLLVMAQGGAQGGQAVQPTTVKEAALGDFPRGPRTGMVNAPNYLPEASNTAQPAWAICDVADVRGTRNESQVESSAKIRTRVVGGDTRNGTPIDPRQSLYVQDQSSGKKFLIYVPGSMPDQPHTRAVRAEVDENEPAVMDMFKLNGATPRKVSTKMLNAVPEAPKLTVPSLINQHETAAYMGGRNHYEVGDVVSMSVPGQNQSFFVLLPQGKQRISAGAAAVLHAAKANSTTIPNATNALTEAPEVAPNTLPVQSYPQEVPTPVTFQQSPNSCLNWQNVNGEQQISMTTAKEPMTAQPPVQLAQADGEGPNVDEFYMPAGKAAVLRGAANEDAAGTGPIYLVSDQGVQYGVKDVQTAQGLGVASGAGDIKDGPSWLQRVLPAGDFLDPAQASFVYDSIPVPPGGVNRPPPKQQGGSSAAAGA